MNCPQCGFVMSAESVECPRCHGTGVYAQATGVEGDSPSFVMALVGFLIPLAGFIIYFVTKATKPLQARSASRGALLGCGLCLPGLLILPAILFPVFARARENARRASCQSNLKQVALATMKYSQTNNGQLPDLSTPASIRVALQSYVTDPKVFVCPSDGQPYQGNAALSHQALDSVGAPEATIMLHDANTVHLDGGNAAYVDGHVKWLHERLWQK